MAAHGPIPKGFQLPFLAELEDAEHKRPGYHPAFKNYAIIFVVINILFFIFAPQQAILNWELVFYLSPIWVTYILVCCIHKQFGQMTLWKFLSEQEYVLLELRIPREITKTPQAMETFLSNMHIGSGETTWYKRYIQGGRRPWWSLEIVSLGGRLHFYIWTRTGYRRLVESFLYAQYPEVEIIEAEDYSMLVDPSHEGYGMWGCEYKLRNANNALPIKTYVDYKMEPGDKPEESVDPLGQILETMGSIGPGEQMWLQIMFRTNKGEKFKNFLNAQGKPMKWGDYVKEAIEGIRTETVRKTKRVDPVTGAETETESFPNPSRGQSEGIANIERKASKQIFDVGIRAIYSAPEDKYQGIMIPFMINMFKPFNNETATGNALELQIVWGALFNDLPWEDRTGEHKKHLEHELIQMYRRRAYFYPPYEGAWMNLSTEELATLYHIPSAAVTTPSLERIQSATGSAPANLPS
jgi:hypothetical protein